MKIMSDLFESTFKKFPRNIAIVTGQERLSYFKLKCVIDKLAYFFLKSGINYQDKVAIFLPNSSLFVAAFFAVSKIGAIAVTLNINYKEEEVRNYLQFCGIKYLLSDKRNINTYEEKLEKIAVKCINVEAAVDLTYSSASAVLPEINSNIKPSDEGLRQFSSGSTGKPKIVGRTHLNILSEAENVSKAIKISPQDKILCAVPLFHAYGFGSAMTPSVYSGATLILVDKFNPRKILRILKKERITIFLGVPYMFNMLSEAVTNKIIKLPYLKFCFSAGISLPPDVSKKFFSKFGLYPRDLYGTTETGFISVNLSKNIKGTLDSVGRPLKIAKVDIVLENRKKAKSGQKGEIRVKTSTCGRLYYVGTIKKPFLKDGYFYTGDIGKIDARGNLYILGRNTTFINVAGTKVDPKEVESVLSKYPGIKEAVVLGIPDKLRGEIVKAVVALNGSILDEKILQRYCRERLADFKVPRIIEFRSFIPRSPLGKILKGYL